MVIEFIEQCSGFLLGTTTSLFASWLWLRRKRKLKERLDFLENEKKLIITISKSSISYARYTIQSIMYALALMCTANIIPIITKIFEPKGTISVSSSVELAFLGAAAAVLFKSGYIGSASYKENTSKHVEKIDKKIAKTKSKLDDV